MTAHPGKNASTYKHSLVGERLKVDQAQAGKYFETIFVRRGFNVNDLFIVIADNQDKPETRIIIFEDSHGRVGTGVASMFLVVDEKP